MTKICWRNFNDLCVFYTNKYRIMIFQSDGLKTKCCEEWLCHTELAVLTDLNVTSLIYNTNYS